MSLSSTSTLKAQIKGHLGPKADIYFATLNLFVTGQTSRTEFDDSIRTILDTPNLVQLHNALIISLFDATTHKRPPSPTAVPRPRPPPRKRRRVLPYQGPGEDLDALSLRSARLKRWALSVGKRERERLKSFQPSPLDARPLLGDEISAERGVTLLPERGNAPGSHMPVHLAATAGAPTVQHIADRMNLICAQNNLAAPNRSVPSLMNLACEAMLKQLLTHALTLTSTSQTISSITPSHTAPSSSHPTSLFTPRGPPRAHHPYTQPVLTTSSFNTLFTVSPADLPTASAAALRLGFMGDSAASADAYGYGAGDEDRDVVLLKDREVRDQRWQIIALLGERSTVREVLRGRAGGM
ncbi:transcriptional regulator of RNA polII, SAGA, subunit-domain-containing protein [Mycena albidolilacea]|uniref:Transcriptional regulator of RNA polII, SAGA, subunit-domain-containing protein n=1 Tax=Mycena albidolilacea TaxID=1033008 RepID=A0AAD7A414_9AGAR|nr:transcriptional regulator of RNA polII, SAGA, subunit-domain-containing protein [Mycena albidolilacea]